MNGQVCQPNCAPVRLVPWTIDIWATIVAMGAAVAVASLITIAGDGASARSARGTTGAFSRLAGIPSHNGVYRASLTPSSGQAARFDSPMWTVKVETAVGAPVDDATLALESWMPEIDSAHAARPRVTGYLGDGRYRVEGLHFDRRGWWNVRLQIARPNNTDSLAFNLVR